MFLRAASSLSLRLLPPGALSRLLAPLQLGIGAAGGVEAIIHRVQALLELHPDHVLLSLDFVNGFNSMFRHVMLKRLYSLPELSSLWRIADLCYGIPSPLHLFDRAGLVESFTSQRGSRQGCVLGTLLFCLGLQPILESASDGLNGVTVSAYIDDIAVVGPLDEVAVFFERLEALSPDLGLTISLPKSSLLWASDLQVPRTVEDWARSHNIPLLLGAVPLLGSMVGLNPILRQQSAIDRVRSMEPFFQALLHPLFTTQATFLLLRVCALPKLNFTCRTLPSRLTSSACAAFDQLVQGAAMTTLRLDKDSLPEKVLPLDSGAW